jgi:hypothetical protein
MKKLVRSSHYADRIENEYDDGSVEVMHHQYGDAHIVTFKTKEYPSKAHYEIAKLDEATAKRLGK